MTDVFVRVWAESMVRLHLAAAVVTRVQMLADARVSLIACSTGRCPYAEGASTYLIAPEDFARESRRVAEHEARSPAYVLIDDDHLPIGRDWLARGLAALEAFPEYVMLSSWSVNGEVPAPADRPEVWEIHSSGTPCFVRKGTFADLPVASAKQYDNALSAHLRRDGARLGFLRDVRHNHLGYGLSQVVPVHWKA